MATFKQCSVLNKFIVIFIALFCEEKNDSGIVNFNGKLSGS